MIATIRQARAEALSECITQRRPMCLTGYPRGKVYDLTVPFWELGADHPWDPFNPAMLELRERAS